MTKLQNYIWLKKYKAVQMLLSTNIKSCFTRFLTVVRLFMQHGFVIYLVVFAIACGKKLPGKPETIMALQQIQELATVEYTVSKVVKANDNATWYKWGNRKILFTCEASLKAGIDLSKITEENISIEGRDISIQLPEPALLSINLPPDKIKVAYSEIGGFRSDFSNQEKDAFMAQAEKQIIAAAPQTGILSQAKLNTQTFLVPWLHKMGFERVSLVYSNNEPVIQHTTD